MIPWGFTIKKFFGFLLLFLLFLSLFCCVRPLPHFYYIFYMKRSPCSSSQLSTHNNETVKEKREPARHPLLYCQLSVSNFFLIILVPFKSVVITWNVFLYYSFIEHPKKKNIFSLPELFSSFCSCSFSGIKIATPPFIKNKEGNLKKISFHFFFLQKFSSLLLFTIPRRLLMTSKTLVQHRRHCWAHQQGPIKIVSKVKYNIILLQLYSSSPRPQ